MAVGQGRGPNGVTLQVKGRTAENRGIRSGPHLPSELSSSVHFRPLVARCPRHEDLASAIGTRYRNEGQTGRVRDPTASKALQEPIGFGVEIGKKGQVSQPTLGFKVRMISRHLRLGILRKFVPAHVPNAWTLEIPKLVADIFGSSPMLFSPCLDIKQGKV